MKPEEKPKSLFRKIQKELAKRLSILKKTSPRDIVLWMGIGVFVSIFSIIVLKWWTILVWMIIIVGRPYKLSVTTFLAVFTLSIALVNLDYQNKLLSNQLIQSQLEWRPYLFVDFNYLGSVREKDILFGANMIFRNTGKTPAKIIKAQYLICDEKECHDYKKWYSDTYGGFPEIKLVPPNSNTGPFPYAAGLLKGSKYACIGVLLTYQGIESNKEYWFYEVNKFKLDIAEDGGIKNSHQISHDVQWDENKDREKPNLIKPDFPIN